MRLSLQVLSLGLLVSVVPSAIAVSWGFRDATVSVQKKGAGVGAGVHEKFLENKPLSQIIKLGEPYTLKVTLTTREGESPKKPHQAFLQLKDPDTGLDISYPFNVKDNGKAKLELTQDDLPIQFLRSPHPFDAKIIIGSFGNSVAHRGTAFNLRIERSTAAPIPSPEVERYGKLKEIRHIFKPSAKSPPIIVTLVFVVVVLAASPLLVGIWVFLGANLDHLPVALKSASLPHVIFVGSIIGLEGIFFMYYTCWTLFQTLPAVLAVGSITFLSGSRALSEVQGRRLAGLR